MRRDRGSLPVALIAAPRPVVLRLRNQAIGISGSRAENNPPDDSAIGACLTPSIPDFNAPHVPLSLPCFLDQETHQRTTEASRLW